MNNSMAIKLRRNFGITSEKLRNNFEETSELIQNPSKDDICPTKTSAGTRKLPMTEEVYQMFKSLVENRSLKVMTNSLSEIRTECQRWLCTGSTGSSMP